MNFKNKIKPGSKIDDYSEPARGILSDPGKFLESLFTYDKENIPDSVIQKIEPYINSEKFTPAAISQANKINIEFLLFWQFCSKPICLFINI